MFYYDYKMQSLTTTIHIGHYVLRAISPVLWRGQNHCQELLIACLCYYSLGLHLRLHPKDQWGTQELDWGNSKNLSELPPQTPAPCRDGQWDDSTKMCNVGDLG